MIYVFIQLLIGSWLVLQFKITLNSIAWTLYIFFFLQYICLHFNRSANMLLLLFSHSVVSLDKLI